MINFWENISRYPRFFISAMVGLVLILTTPFQTLLRTRLGNLVFVTGFSILLLFIGVTLKEMLDW